MELGGYFELELPYGKEFHQNALRLNTGRNALEYILKAKKYKKIYIPYYTCDVILEPIKRLKIEYHFYNIDFNFNPIFNFNKINHNEVFLYNNYFGICDNQTQLIAKQCKNLIIDNSQSFFSIPIKGVDTFYSPRKFFGIPDGAYLYTDTFLDDTLEKDTSYKFCEHLLGRIDNGAETHFNKYKENSRALSNQSIKKMSNLTQRLLTSIDYNNIANKRINNFNFIHEKLINKNKLEKISYDFSGPMIYPLFTENGSILRNKLIENKIYIAKYWPNVLEFVKPHDTEYMMVNNIVAIPIDQRCNFSELHEIVKLLQ